MLAIRTKNHDVENIHQWLLANKLTLNKEKTEYMVARNITSKKFKSILDHHSPECGVPSEI
jgi:hypothetical protein